MSGAFPISSAKFSTLGIKSIQNTIISKSLSGKKLARQIDNQRFGFTVNIIIGTRSSIYGELMAFIMQQRSGKENFTIIPPEIEDARGHETGTILVDGVHAIGDSTINIDGHTNNNANAFRSGDFIKFASHDKVYMIVSNVTPALLASTITIEPPLLIALTNNSTVTYDDVPFTVHLTNDVQEFGVVDVAKNGSLLYQFQFDVEESL